MTMATFSVCISMCLAFMLIFPCRALSPADISKIEAHEGEAEFVIEYRRQRLFSLQDYGYKNFACPDLEVHAPKDIHSLSPKYVKVIAALGDSLTAANGAEALTLLGVGLQYRGVSFSIGGDKNLKTSVTLPNIIKVFNTIDLFGPSRAISTVENEKLSKLNVGVPGARARDLVNQAKMLVERLGKHIKYTYEWKLVTVAIGANDICVCKNQDLQDPDQAVKPWIGQIIEAIDILAHKLPNTFVNLVSVVDVGALREYEVYGMCTFMHKVMCPCVTKASKDYNATEELTRKYQQAMYGIPPRYKNLSNFTVVLQTFSENIIVPVIHGKHNTTKPDLKFLAPDCFHFSRHGHVAGAAALWNCMMTPVQQKENIMDPSILKLFCPDPACPYLRTEINSVSCG